MLDAATGTVEACTPLEAIHQRAAEAGRLFPPDLGARGSCTIGGEGTLGIVTRAVLRLFPRPLSTNTALCSVAHLPVAIALLLPAFEATWANSMLNRAGFAGGSGCESRCNTYLTVGSVVVRFGFGRRYVALGYERLATAEATALQR